MTNSKETPTSLEGKDDKIVARNINRVYQIKQSDGESFTEFQAIKQLDLTVRQGEFLAIVGPSGCGKSTFLDMIAGLAKPSSGEILIDGKKITGPALDRGIVLQGYALFPWRTVRKNVEFGLEVKKVPEKEREAISQRYIELVGLKNFENRVAVMTANPGTIKDIVTINLPRPRDGIRSSAEFGWIRHKIWGLLQNDTSIANQKPYAEQNIADSISPSVAL